MFAIVDVETTGGHPSGHGLTEIGIVIHDGIAVQQSYSTLLNPGQHIPLTIQSLTGINNEMVASAPSFSEVCTEIQEILAGHIFVAHNVNFDYSFIKAAFNREQIEYNPRRLCTVRYARKIEKGLKSYALGNLCKHFGLTNKAAHRALGDAEVTAQILEILLTKDLDAQWQYLVKKNSGELNLPANLPSKKYTELPEKPGVYYFLGEDGKPIYIGKAKNLKKRVASHFVSDKESKKSQSFKRDIFDLKHELTGSELVASLLEDHEIRQYWPIHNKAQKKPKTRFGVFSFYNQKEIPSLAINKISHQTGYLREFYRLQDAQSWVLQMVDKYRLNPAKCGFPFSEASFNEAVDNHPNNFVRFLKDQTEQQQSRLLKTQGRTWDEDGFIWIKDGQLAGYGFVPHSDNLHESEEVLRYAIPLKSSITTVAILRKELEKESDNWIALKS